MTLTWPRSLSCSDLNLSSFLEGRAVAEQPRRPLAESSNKGTMEEGSDTRPVQAINGISLAALLVLLRPEPVLLSWGQGYEIAVQQGSKNGS